MFILKYVTDTFKLHKFQDNFKHILSKFYWKNRENSITLQIVIIGYILYDPEY